jgi:serine/tyrosine/threonine adenylyltransferase
MKKLSTQTYKNEFISTFKGDESGDLSPRQTPDVFYSKAIPTPVNKPDLLGWSDELAEELGIQKPDDQKDIDILGGNYITPTMYPYAARYGGHQFGNWAAQLGDGRAITLGEWEHEGRSWDLQLKGAGPTAYSRRADGRAVLRSSVREYLMSEAMFHLGVPTTRALSLVSTGEQIMRDMFYNGNPEYEPGAIVMRVAPTFIRFGNFEIFTSKNEIENLKKLTDYTIDRFYPHISGEDKVLSWLREVVEKTATMVVEWLRVGFVHGVMNTDNMSILGLTIDYGPYSFLDNYDPNFTPNTTDLPGRRYAFGNQASIAYWNLGCLANALTPLVSEQDKLIEIIESYEDIFWLKYYSMMAKKLGIDRVKEQDIPLIDRFDKTLADLKPDMTIFYQLLQTLPLDIKNEQQVLSHFKESFYDEPSTSEQIALFNLMETYITRIGLNNGSREESLQLMKKANPRFILRNYLLHQAIENLEHGKPQLFDELQQAIKEPYSDKFDRFVQKRPDWASDKAGCSMLSCSS